MKMLYTTGCRVNVAAGFEDLDCWYADLVIYREVEDGQYGGTY